MATAPVQYSYTGPMIHGVELKMLRSFHDERGFFREIFRASEPIFEGGRFAQWSHSRMVKDVVKAWHYHHVQYDWWYVPFGKVRVVLYDNREESPTFGTKMDFILGESAKFGGDTMEASVRIPPGVLHGCRVLSEEAHLFYITSETYDPKEEGRIPFDSAEVPHDWGANALVVENDKRNFTPVRPRARLDGACIPDSSKEVANL